MADNKKSNKVRLILSIIFAVIAIVALVVTVLISPIGSKILGKEETTTQKIVETTTEKATETTTEATDSTENAEVSEETEPTSETIVVPPPTQPVENIYKNYTLFINTFEFSHTEKKGVTTITRNDNNDIKMVITPKGDTSYAALCESSKALLGDEKTDKKLPISALNACFSSESDGIVTTIYCVDDGKGGSVEIKCQYPASDEKAESQFTLMLSMFKIV